MFELLIEVWQYGHPPEKPSREMLWACYQMCETTPEKLIVFPTLSECEKERTEGVGFFTEQKMLALVTIDRKDKVKKFRLTCRPHKGKPVG